MRIIIVGTGKVGGTLTKQLAAEKHDVTIIDRNPDVIEDIVNTNDVLGVCGNGANYDVQKEAGAAEADLLIATTSIDEVNILACLVAKRLGVQHTIARVRNPEYEKQLRFMRDELGLSMVINPEKATAREISRVLRFPAALKLETFSKGRIELIEYRIPEKSALVDVQLSALYHSVRARVLICAVAREENVVIPSGDFVLRAGDKVYLTASRGELETFFRHLGVFQAKATSVIIVGASRICYYLSKDLTDMGMSVKIIDRDEQQCALMSERLPRALVIHGDGADHELLNEEGLGRCDAFVALTGIDEANIIMCMYATKQNVGKVVAKINRRSFSDLVSEDTRMGSVVSAGAVTSELILQYVRAMQNSMGSNIRTLHRIVNDRVEALEFGAAENMSLLGVPFKDLDLRENLLIAGIVRENGTIVIPSGQDCLNAGDSVIVVTTNTTLHDLSDIIR